MSSTPVGAFQLQPPEPVEPFEDTAASRPRAAEASPPARRPAARSSQSRRIGAERIGRHSCATKRATPRRSGRRQRRGSGTRSSRVRSGLNVLQGGCRIGRAGRREGDVDAEADHDGEAARPRRSLCPSSRRPETLAPSSSRSFGHFRDEARRPDARSPPRRPRAGQAPPRSRVAARRRARTGRSAGGWHRGCPGATTIAGRGVPCPPAARRR